MSGPISPEAQARSTAELESYNVQSGEMVILIHKGPDGAGKHVFETIWRDWRGVRAQTSRADLKATIERLKADGHSVRTVDKR